MVHILLFSERNSLVTEYRIPSASSVHRERNEWVLQYSSLKLRSQMGRKLKIFSDVEKSGQ
tara:strand:+ start:414 stop:596 length:183 start_codon:yes stop_codon:yes gene_type:complete